MKQHLLIATVLLCLGPVGILAQQKAKPTIGSVLQKGRAAVSAGDREKACKIYQEGADQLEGYGRRMVLRELARTLLAMKKSDEALVVYEKLLTEEQDRYARQRTLHELAGALDRMGKYEKAMETYKVLMGEYTVRDRQRYELLGSVLRIANHTGKGKEYMEKARADLKSALQQALSKADREELIWRTHMQLGDSWFLMRRYKEAADDYNAALPHAPESARYRINKKLLLCYEQLKDYPGIIRACAGLMVKSSSRTGSPYAQKLSQAYFMLGKEDEGLEAISRADPYTAARVAGMMTTAGRFDSSEKLLKRALEKNPDNTKLLCALARLNWYRDRCDKALAIYRKCYAKTPPSSSELFWIAKNISGVHIDKKDIDEAAVAERKHLETLKAGKGPAPEHRDNMIRPLLLTALMEYDADDYSSALRHLTELEPMVKGHTRLSGSVRSEITRTALAAVSDLLARGEIDEAERALLVLKGKPYRKTLATEYAEYVILDRKGRAEEAARKLHGIQDAQQTPVTLRLTPGTLRPGRVARLGSESSHWRAATFLARIGLMDLAVEEWKRTIETLPRNTRVDKMSAVQLGEYYAEQGRSKEALEWFGKARNIRDQGISPKYSAYWRRRELRVRYDVSGGDPDVVAAFLTNNVLSYRVAAMQLLKDVGTPSHVPQIEASGKYMPQNLRDAAQAAVLGIKSRFHLQFELGLASFDEKKLRETLAQKVKLLWIKQDEADPSLRWVGVKDGFVLLADLKHQALHNFKDSLGLLDNSPPTPTSMAFAKNAVWVGTEKGAFAYDRGRRAWSQYAIMGKYLDEPVDKVEHMGQDWVLTVRGKGRFLFAPETRFWRKLGG